MKKLKLNHEEADTRLFLHADHIAQSNYTAIVNHAQDTDVRLLAVVNAPHSGTPLLQWSSTQVLFETD